MRVRPTRGRNPHRYQQDENNMTRKLLTTLAFLSTLIALTCCGAQPPPTSESPTATAPAVAKPIVLGDVSDAPAKGLKSYQPMADYLAAHLGTFGFTIGKVK